MAIALVSALAGPAALLTFVCSGKSPPCWCPTADRTVCTGGSGGARNGRGDMGRDGPGDAPVGGSANGAGVGGASTNPRLEWAVRVGTDSNAEAAMGTLLDVRGELGEDGVVYRKDSLFITTVGQFATRDLAHDKAESIALRHWRWGEPVVNVNVLCPDERVAEIDVGTRHLKYFDCR